MLTSISPTQCSRHHFTSINSLVLPAPSFLIDSVCYRLYTVGRRLSVCLLFTSTRDGCAQRQEQTCYLLLPLIRAEDLLPSVHTSNIISFSHILFNPLPHRRHDSPGPKRRIHHSVFWFHCDRELITQRPPTGYSLHHFDLSTTLTELRLTARHSHSLCCVFRPSPSTFPRDFEKPLDIQVPTPLDLHFKPHCQWCAPFSLSHWTRIPVQFDLRSKSRWPQAPVQWLHNT